jgi:hypothetical protein
LWERGVENAKNWCFEGMRFFLEICNVYFFEGFCGLVLLLLPPATTHPSYFN